MSPNDNVIRLLRLPQPQPQLYASNNIAFLDPSDIHWNNKYRIRMASFTIAAQQFALFILFSVRAQLGFQFYGGPDFFVYFIQAFARARDALPKEANTLTLTLREGGACHIAPSHAG